MGTVQTGVSGSFCPTLRFKSGFCPDFIICMFISPQRGRFTCGLHPVRAGSSGCCCHVRVPFGCVSYGELPKKQYKNSSFLSSRRGYPPGEDTLLERAVGLRSHPCFASRVHPAATLLVGEGGHTATPSGVRNFFLASWSRASPARPASRWRSSTQYG